MKKIILIEDRLERQKQFMSETQIKELSTLIELDLKTLGRAIIEDINDSKISLSLEKSDLLIFHRSVLNNKGIQTLFDYCQKNKKDLILFSGGISQVTYNGEKFQFLVINSKDFYNDNLIKFLQEYKKGEIQSLLELIYGEKWKLTALLQYRHFKFIMDNELDVREQERIKTNHLERYRNILNEDIEDINKRINSIIEIL